MSAIQVTNASLKPSIRFSDLEMNSSDSIESTSEISNNASCQKKKRTVTFAEIDVSELNSHSRKSFSSGESDWKRRAVQRKRLRRRKRQCKEIGLKVAMLVVSIALVSLITLLTTAQGTVNVRHVLSQ